ncbi:MAG TPA: translocation/assembly module TamB domain-containing protein, partial [Candidatus Binatia bacterium]|nr:translocation/assembly module TamB domain-containing protein [Candidatus Binatia bacterium]
VGGLITSLLLALVAAGLYMRTARFQDWARTRTVAILRDSLNGEVSIERISGSIWSEIVIHNLSVIQNGVEVLSVPRLAVTVHLLSQAASFLSSSTMHVSAVTLTTPVVRLVQDPHTGWNISTLVKPPKAAPQEPSTFRLFLDHLGLERGEVVVRTATGEESRVTALSTDGNLAVLPAGTRAELSSLTFSLARAGMPEVQWSGGGLVYDATQAPPVLELRHTDLRTGNSHLQLAGTANNLSAPTLAFTADIERLASGDVQLLAPAVPLQEDLSGTVRVNGPLSALQLETTVNAPDGQITAATTLNLTQTPPHYEGTLAVQQLVAHKVLRLDDMGGEISGQLTFAGETPETSQGTLRLQAANLFARGQEINSLVVTGDLAQGRATLSGEARGPVGEVGWQGQIVLGSPLAYEANLTARNIVPARAAGGKITVPLRLNVDAWVKGSGTSLGEIDAATKLTLLPSQVGSLTNVNGQLLGKLQHQQFTLDTLKVVANDSSLTAQGKLGDLPAAPQGTLTYTLAAQNLTPWLALLGQQGAGALRLEGSAAGSLTALRVEGKTTLSNLKLAGSTLQSGTLTYALRDVGSPRLQGQVTAALTQMAAGIRWRTAKVNLSLRGTQPMEVQTEFTGQDEQNRTQRLATQIHYQPERLEVLVKELAVQLPAGTWRNRQPAQLVMQNKTLTIDNFVLQQADHTVSAGGTFAWQGQQDLRVQVTHLPLADIRTLLGSGPQVSGSVSSEVHVRGTAASPEIDLSLDTSAVTVAGQTYAGLSVRSAYRQQQLQVNALFRQDTDHTLTAEGSVPLSLAWAGEPSPTVLGEADLRVRSAGLSLAFLNLLSPSSVQDVKGTVSVDVRVRGPVNAPAPSGNIQLQQGQAHVKALGLTFQDIGVQAQLAPGAVQISQLMVRADDGRLTGNGRVSLQQYTVSAFDLTLNAERFRVIRTPQFTAAVSGQLSGSGSLQQPVLRGELKLEDTSLRPDFSLLKSGPAKPDATIVVARSEQELKARPQPPQPTHAASQAPSPGGPYEHLSLDLAVTVPRGTWVYLDEGTVELMGKLNIRKEPNREPFLVGAIETVRGWYTFHNRKFTLERGQVTFTGGTPIDPSLDVDARSTLQKYKIDIVIGGTAHDPTFALRSEPSLEQADILSLLIFGKTTDGLNSGEKSSLQSEMMSATAGYFANDLRRAVAEKLGLDNLEFDVGNTVSQSRIGAGKYLSENVFVSTSHSSMSADRKNQGQEFAVEYQMRENWQLKASTTTTGNNGVDIFWQKRY